MFNKPARVLVPTSSDQEGIDALLELTIDNIKNNTFSCDTIIIRHKGDGEDVPSAGKRSRKGGAGVSKQDGRRTCDAIIHQKQILNSNAKCHKCNCYLDKETRLSSLETNRC